MITETIAHLRAHQADAGLAMVAGAAAFGKAVEGNPTTTPAVFVVPLNERPSARAFSGDDTQRVDVEIGVVTALRNVADASGEAALDALTPVRDGIKAQLLGFIPIAGYAGLERGPGQMLAFRDGHLWWQDVYRSYYFERQP